MVCRQYHSVPVKSVRTAGNRMQVPLRGTLNKQMQHPGILPPDLKQGFVFFSPAPVALLQFFQVGF